MDGMRLSCVIAVLQYRRMAGFHSSCNSALVQLCNTMSAVAEYPPKYRPSERFWPYADLPEQPTDEELAALDPDLQEALFGAPRRPLSLTVVFPHLDIPRFADALEMARASAEFRETGSGEGRRYRARFWPSDAAK